LAVVVTKPDGRIKSDAPRSKQMMKFKSQVWQLVIHCSMAMMEMQALADLEASEGASLLEQGHLSAHILAENPVNVYRMYIFQSAVWIVTGLFHIFIFERQSDYLVMLGHHVATLGLMGVSYWFHFHRFGLIVLFVHDVSDIWIDLLKIFNYLKLQDAAGFFLVEGVFTCNLISWVYFRLYIFPFKIVRSAFDAMTCAYALSQAAPGSVDMPFIKQNTFLGMPICWSDRLSDSQVQEIISPINSIAARLGYDPDYAAGYIWMAACVAVVLLIVLAIMHVYWFLLFLRLLYKIVVVGSHEAGRQEYEGDDDSVDEKPKKN